MSRQALTWQLECHDELPSTSDYCLNHIRQGGGAGLAVMAQRQTKGRGSRGRQWLDAGQALALSVVLDAAQDHALGGWPFVASLAFYEGLIQAVPQAAVRLTIKWPNDILLDGHKLGGILIEREGACVVIGMGANLLCAPDEADIGRRAASLGACGPVPDTADVARFILSRLAFWTGIWQEKGFEAIRLAWLERAHPLGTPLVVRGGSTYEEGHFAGLAADGRLLLDTATGMKTIATGDILLPEGRV